MSKNEYRIESESEVDTYLSQLRYALDSGATIYFQEVRRVDNNREEKFTNRYTIAYLFPKENPEEALRRELKKLTVQNYLRTVKDIRFPNRSEMREFGKIYNGSEEIYIKIRVELLNPLDYGKHTTFVMSFHFAEKAFSEEFFPYKKESKSWK